MSACRAEEIATRMGQLSRGGVQPHQKRRNVSSLVNPEHPKHERMYVVQTKDVRVL